MKICVAPGRWITPACAGRRPWKCTAPSLCRDHPRVCGEKDAINPPEEPAVGSPPRVRGEDRNETLRNLRDRITPACAGRSPAEQAAQTSAGDHPRVCGEKQNQLAEMRAVFGSPPRVRGEAHPRFPQALHRGITPACAGRRLRSSFCGQWAGDHPRVCGEKTANVFHACSQRGSPPRVRGEALVTVGAAGRNRITPACAGRSGHIGMGSAVTRDHPRVCGEKSGESPEYLSDVGSPPRVRGEENMSLSYFLEGRITPACAGRSAGDRHERIVLEDHPRVCGEKATA